VVKRDLEEIAGVYASKQGRPYYHTLAPYFWDSSFYSHLFNTRFACAATRTDFVDAWYRAPTFHIPNRTSHKPDLDYLDRSLQHDQWDCGVHPADRICSVVLHDMWSVEYLTSVPKHLEKLRRGSTIILHIPDLPSSYAIPRELELSFRTEKLIHKCLVPKVLLQLGYKVLIRGSFDGRLCVQTLEGHIYFSNGLF
jgi:hypothetical protein